MQGLLPSPRRRWATAHSCVGTFRQTEEPAGEGLAGGRCQRWPAVLCTAAPGLQLATQPE